MFILTLVYSLKNKKYRSEREYVRRRGAGGRPERRCKWRLFVAIICTDLRVRATPLARLICCVRVFARGGAPWRCLVLPMQRVLLARPAGVDVGSYVCVVW